MISPKHGSTGVSKLVTNTCISSSYFRPIKAQKVLVEKSEYCFKASVFDEYSQKREYMKKGDYHLINTNITFTLIDPIQKYRETDDDGKSITKKWKVKYSLKGKEYYGYIYDNDSQDMIIKAVNDACASIKKQTLKTCELGREDDGDNHFVLVSFPGYRRNKEDDKKAIVYSVGTFGLADYYIETGLFCGLVNFGDGIPPLEIRTEYSDTLIMRMIDRCCGIYADTRPDDGDLKLESFYSKIVQYMYLLSLRKVISILVPKRYKYHKDRGYCVRGNVDINSYVSRDLIEKDRKVSFIYPERHEIQSLIDILYAAIKCCKSLSSSSLPNLKGYEDYLGSIYSGRYPSSSVIRNIGKEKALKTGLYSAFKRPIELAGMILENSELSTGESESERGISALLMDSSYLWETYLESVMREGLKDWNIDAQTTVVYYPETFYSKENRPDFILTNNNTGEVFILDAKFKHMEFSREDVDNHDVQQLHCYSYYYLLANGSNFRGTALIYPTRKDQSSAEATKNFYEIIFGVDYASDMQRCDQRFGIITLKDANECEQDADYKDSYDNLSESEKLDYNERIFIKRLEAFFESCRREGSLEVESI